MNKDIEDCGLKKDGFEEKNVDMKKWQTLS